MWSYDKKKSYGLHGREEECVQGFGGGKPEEKRPFERLRCRQDEYADRSGRKKME